MAQFTHEHLIVILVIYHRGNMADRMIFHVRTVVASAVIRKTKEKSIVVLVFFTVVHKGNCVSDWSCQEAARPWPSAVLQSGS